MQEYLKINNMQIYFSLLLLTLNVPLQVGKCTLGAHMPQVGNPWPSCCSSTQALPPQIK